MRLMTANGKRRRLWRISIREVVHFFSRAPDIPVTDLVRLADECGKERLVAEIVDDARNSTAASMQRAQCPAGETRPAIAPGQRKPVVSIMRHVAASEGMQFVVDENSLAQLAQFFARQDLLQFRLPHQYNLEQLLFVGFQIRKEPNLLEHVEAEILRFVDDEYDVAVAVDALEQHAVHLTHEVMLIFRHRSFP